MKLYIVKDEDSRIQLQDGIMLLAKHLMFNSTHLFIASNYWDEVNIELCDDIPRNTLKYVITRTTNVKFTIKNPTLHQVKLLSEVYPEKQGLFKRTFAKGGDLNELLS